MNKLFKSINLFLLAVILTTYSCSNDDEGSVANNSISIENLTVTLDENPTDGQAIGTVETDGTETLSLSITSQTPAGALSIASSTGALTVANAALFDFETNPIITATVTAVGASSPATVTINLNNLNEASLQDLTLAVDENPTDGQVLGTVQGSGTSNFSISSQTPAGALAIDATSGEVTVADAVLFDFETNPVITATVTVDDAENPATVTVNLNNLDEISAQDLTVTIAENPIDGQVVGTIQVDGSGTLSFSIASQTPAGALSINASTGELTVVDPNLFDFETNPVLTVDISVDNSIYTAMAIATINLTDLDEVSAQNSTISINENPTNGDVLGSVPATGGNLNFTITFQNPAGALEINTTTGELTVADAALFDFETNQNMLAVVSVGNSVNTVSVNANININDLNEIGEFKYGGVIFWIDPTNNNDGLVTTVNDLNSGNSISWNNGANVPGAEATAIGFGQANTTAIVAAQATGTYAASLCDNLTLNTYSDWFLPSYDEAYQIYLNRTIINTTSVANGGANLYTLFYWTSTQDSGNANIAHAQHMTTGNLVINNKGNLARVRAVRAF